MKRSTTRYYPFDLSRSICVIWIVGVWHMRQYLPLELQFSEMALPIYKSITMGVLACFTFLSGYFLKKYKFCNIKDVLVFYKRRFIRFYPLFVVAAFSFIICGSTIRQILLAIFGLSMLYPPPIQTLWYFSMLLLFYLMTPLLTIRKDDVRISIISIFLIITILTIGYLFFDKRFVIYLPFYVLGLNVPNHAVDRVFNPFTLVASIVVFVLICLWGQDNILLQIIQSLCSIVVILSFSKLIYIEKFQRPVAFVAEASMCAYLFHRPLYSIIVVVLREITEYQFLTIPTALFSIVVLFVIAYFIQSLYNNLIHQISYKYGK